MQHGTGRELVAEALDNVEAVLRYERDANGRPFGDLIRAIETARAVLNDPDLDRRGLYGPDYPTPERRDGPFQVPHPVGRIDTRRLGR